MEDVNKVLPDKYLEKLNTLNLYRVFIRTYEEKEDHAIITFDGGYNGSGSWSFYMHQISDIIEILDAWVIDLINDCPDDVWTLRIGVKL